jgi:hypothetical protein
MLSDLSKLYLKPPPGEHSLPHPDRVEDHNLIPLPTSNTVIVYTHIDGLPGFKRSMDIASSHPNIYLDTHLW